MTDQCAFRSTASAVLDVWAENKRRHSEFHDAVDQLAADYPMPDGSKRPINGSQWVLHATVGSLGGPRPEGPWRELDGEWVPNRRSKAGKALADRLEATSVQYLLPPGIPHHAAHEGRLVGPGFLVHEGVAWVYWNCPASTLSSVIDCEIWTAAQMSEFWAAREAADAAEPR